MARVSQTLIAAVAVFVVACSGGPLRGHATQVECSGTVVDFRAQAVTDAEVVCCRQVYDYAAGCIRWNVLGRAVTDARGRFRVLGEATDLMYLWVFVRKPGLSIGWYGSLYQGPVRNLSICLRQSEAYVGTVVDEKGQGVCDATVGVRIKLDSMCQWPFQDPERWCAARTDSQGRFRIEQIPPGAVADFRVDAPGKAVRFTHDEKGTEDAMGYRVGRDEVRIVLKPEAVLRGRVIDEDSGKPVGGVQLLARPDSNYSNYYCVDPVTSEQDGTFQYRGLQAGVYSLQIVAPQHRVLEWVGRGVKVAAQGGRTVGVKVPVGKGGLIEVTVLDAPAGSPIEDAEVIVEQKATDGRSAAFYGVFRTDARGVALARAPAGECRVEMSADAYGSFSDPEPVRVVKGQVVGRQRSLDALPFVAGVVHDPNGHPARGVIVCSRPACDRTSLSDAQGRFTVMWRPHPMMRDVQVLARDPGRNLVGLVQVKDASRPVDVTLAPAFVVRGCITDPNGKAIPPVKVQLKAHMPRWRIDAAPAVLSDAQGIYEIRAIPAPREDLRYALEIQAEGYGPTRSGELSFASAQAMRVEAPPMILTPADKSISGVVVNAAGKPAAGATVSIYGSRGNPMDGQPSRRTRTDAQGRFVIEGVCPGPLQIRAGAGNRPGDAGQLQAQGGDRDIKIILGRSGVHMQQKSLVGRPLPDMKALLDLPPEQTQGKPILLCFFDINQRSSRNCIDTLLKQADGLRQEGVIVAAIQAGPLLENTWKAWMAGRGSQLAFGRIQDDPETVTSTWGVRSLPWLILTDKDHVVRAEGFQLGEVDGILGRVTETQK